MVTLKTKAKVAKIPLTAEEQFWQATEQRSKELIDQLFHRNLPLEFQPQDLDLENSPDWKVLAREDIPQAHQEDEELDSETLAAEIAYHYLLTILKRLASDLSEYACHDPAYWENLTE